MTALKVVIGQHLFWVPYLLPGFTYLCPTWEGRGDSTGHFPFAKPGSESSEVVSFLPEALATRPGSDGRIPILSKEHLAPGKLFWHIHPLSAAPSAAVLSYRRWTFCTISLNIAAIAWTSSQVRTWKVLFNTVHRIEGTEQGEERSEDIGRREGQLETKNPGA